MVPSAPCETHAKGEHVKGEHVKDVAQNVAQNVAEDVLGAAKDA